MIKRGNFYKNLKMKKNNINLDERIKKIIYLFMFLICLSFVSSFSGSGSGTLADPYQITSWSQLNETRNNLTANYILMNNLNSSSVGYSGIGSDWQPIGNYSDYPTHVFMGSFNGNSNTISDLVINKPYTDYVGLFGFTFGNISNIGVIDVNCVGLQYVGGLVGYSKGTISNSYVMGDVSGNSLVGGLVGYQAFGGGINNSYSTGNVTGEIGIGGLAGANGAVIFNSYSTGNVEGITTVGGFVSSGPPGGPGMNEAFTSYWDVEISGIGLSGDNENGATGKTTAEMQTQSTFTDWNFFNVWAIHPNNYPILAWQDTNITGCRNLTVAGLTYNLQNNIGSDNSTDCLIIQADGVTVNGRGYTISGNVDARGANVGDNAFTSLVLNNVNAVSYTHLTLPTKRIV